MSIRYKSNIEEIDWSQIAGLFASVGWGVRSVESVQKSFQNSSFVRIAFNEDQIIGVGRTVDDGAYYGWVVDLAVLPQFQGNGIGGFILSELENDLKPFITTMLTAAPGKSKFYEKAGWLKQSSAYIFPRNEEQVKDFC